jgi:hypothetical protein
MRNKQTNNPILKAKTPKPHRTAKLLPLPTHTGPFLFEYSPCCVKNETGYGERWQSCKLGTERFEPKTNKRNMSECGGEKHEMVK